MAHLTFTDSSFKEQVLDSKTPVLVDFWAEWCPPCKIIAPLIEELADEFADKVVVGTMDADVNTKTTDQFGVMSLPTVMLFKDGKPVQVLVGAQGKHTYKTEIEKLLTS